MPVFEIVFYVQVRRVGLSEHFIPKGDAYTSKTTGSVNSNHCSEFSIQRTRKFFIYLSEHFSK